MQQLTFAQIAVQEWEIHLMHKLGKYLGYTGNSCVNCGRYRVEKFSNGYERCEKCAWVPQIDNYISDDEFYADDLGEE